MRPAFIRTAAHLTLLACTLATARAAESCDPIVTFADGKTPLREVFISPTGSNSTGNGSPANPFQTISRALQGAQPGDAIRLLPGTYPGGTSIGNLTGTSNAPIWIGGVPGQARPVINGGSTAIQLSRVRYVVVENLEVSGATANGLNCDDGGDYANRDATRHVLFRHLDIHDIGTGGNQDGLKLSGVNDYLVLDCEFTRMSVGGSGIDHVGCHHGLIARCRFTDAGSNAIQCKGGSEDIEIRWNTFTNAGARAINIGGSTGFEYFRPPLSTNAPNSESKNIRVIANLFRGSDTPVAYVGTVDSLVAHNTMIQPTRWLMRILQETVSSGGYTFLPCGHNQFLNNVVYFDRSQISTYLNIGANTDAASFGFANNLWYALDQPGQSRPTLPSPETNGLYALNPLFANAATGDFSVPLHSPATGKGLKLAGIRADARERCYANPPTLGAYEAQPPPTDRADADGDLMPDVWEQANGFDRDDPADASLDADGDELSNLGEYLAGTNPRSALSHFSLRADPATANRFVFRYPSLTGRVYRVESRTLTGPAAWAEESVISGTGGEISHLESPLSTNGKMFRVKLGLGVSPHF